MEGTRQRSWLFDVFTHNFAEGLRTARAVERKMHNVGMSDLPYPGNTNTSTVTQSSPVGWVAASLAGASILLGAYGISKLATPPAPVVTPAPNTASVTPATSKPYLWDEVEQIQQKDGTWKNTGKTVRKKMNPDGSVEIVNPGN